ncbi:hypothetical protein P7K49_000865 [Saguinus oedipus]|uniref:Uncharacterized protein n=1 Tax=Saguinus oedipus TaxID=9490 RepID=A0ABQ9WCY3_SAGOE|nr:hypothetical protein P7K49_000865 [Saguinus oedipus]
MSLGGKEESEFSLHYRSEEAHSKPSHFPSLVEVTHHLVSLAPASQNTHSSPKLLGPPLSTLERDLWDSNPEGQAKLVRTEVDMEAEAELGA